MKTKIFLMTAVFTVLSFTSCQKNDTLIDQTSVDLADDEAVTDAIFEDIFSTADNATIILDQITKGGDAKSVVSADTCPVITVTHPGDGLWPKVVTVDFGAGCEGMNNNVRKGKILIEVTAPRATAGAKRTVTFVDYYFNDIKVEGTKVLENKGFSSSQNPLVSITLTGGKLTLPDGKTIERSFQHQREWTAGFLTRNIWDDECLVTGSATGKNIDGLAYTNTIITALQWKRACYFIVAGVIKMERAGKEPVELNYGTGECDAKAVVSRGGESKEILLRNKHRKMNP